MKITDDGSAKKTGEKLKDELNLYKKGLKLEVWRALTIIEAAVMEQIRRTLKRRTGFYMNSIPNTKELIEDEKTVTGVVGSPAPYSLIHEEGGIIKAKKARFLRFPHPENQNADGSPIQERVNKAALIPLRRGGFLVASRTGKDRLQPMFYLKEQVTIPARPHWRPAIRKTEKVIFEKFGLFVNEVFNSKR